MEESVKPSFKEVAESSGIPKELVAAFLKTDLGFARDSYDSGEVSEQELRIELRKSVPLSYLLKRSMSRACE